MRLRKLKWNQHPILGDLELDFINKNINEPYSTIILAGENGTGKTTILETINIFLSIGDFTPFSYIEYQVEKGIYTAIPPSSTNHISTFFDIIDINGEITHIRSDRSNSPDSISKDALDPRSYGTILSKPRADFKTNKISSTSSSDIDQGKYNSDDSDDFTSITQLLVDIEALDHEQYLSINKEREKGENSPLSPSEFEPSSKIHRFKRAFNAFFETIKYNQVSTR